MSIAFHVKHRPSSLEEVIGQTTVVSSLKKVIKDNRAKAFIFTGPAGTGKTTLARILANAFAGKEATAANIEEFDAATNSGADAVRAVIAHTIYRAVGSSPIKAIIIDEAHRLSSAAWTVLLKPIEEPPKHVYWFFCTTEAGKIPKTIQTRCLRYDLKPVKEEQLLELLIRVADAEKLDTVDEVLEAIAENSEGSPRQALVFLETCQYAETANEALAAMRTAGQSKEIIDLCRFLVSEQGRSWAAAVKLIKAMDGVEAESIRIVTLAYLTKTLLNTQNEKKAVVLLSLIECFSTPYNLNDKFAPLLLSVSFAIGLDQ